MGALGAMAQLLRRAFSHSERARRKALRQTLKAKVNEPQSKIFVFFAQGYRDEKGGGGGRHVEQLARAVAALGHDVHVLTRAKSASQTESMLALVDGVWVHRLAIRDHRPPKSLPAPIWNYCASVNEELRHIAEVRGRVDCVYAPIWDCEGAATLMEDAFPLVTALQTPLKIYADLHPERVADEAFNKHFLLPMLELETELFTRSDGVHAISAAIADEISQDYNVDLSGERVLTAPLAIEDWAQLPYERASYPQDALNLLFVGRLEVRKGVDALLKITPELLEAHPNLHIHFVGDDSLPECDGKTYREVFEAQTSEALLSRTHFHGVVAEPVLRGFYRDCDFFVAPSRYESFGLILIEAMIYAKPIVACRVGGMTEVMAEGETGLLAEPGDPEALRACIETLIRNPDLRRRMGQAGRARYERCFTPKVIGQKLVDFMAATQHRHALRKYEEMLRP